VHPVPGDLLGDLVGDHVDRAGAGADAETGAQRARRNRGKADPSLRLPKQQAGSG